MKLLIVDNDRDIVEMLTSWLKTLGYEMHRAYSGERAKLEWEEQKPDHVILGHALKAVDTPENRTRSRQPLLYFDCAGLRLYPDAPVLGRTRSQRPFLLIPT